MSVAIQDMEQASGPELRRWMVSDYERAAEAGVFGPEERLELIEGEIYRKGPQNGPHAVVCDLIEDALRSAFGSSYRVRGQKPLLIGGKSVPEPDVYVIRGPIRDFVKQHPTTAVLVVEASDSTVTFELITKAALYAGAGIPEYWVIAIPERAVVVHREPEPATRTYRSVERLVDTDSVTPLAAPTAVIPVADLLP